MIYIIVKNNILLKKFYEYPKIEDSDVEIIEYPMDIDLEYYFYSNGIIYPKKIKNKILNQNLNVQLKKVYFKGKEYFIEKNMKYSKYIEDNKDLEKKLDSNDFNKFCDILKSFLKDEIDYFKKLKISILNNKNFIYHNEYIKNEIKNEDYKKKSFFYSYLKLNISDISLYNLIYESFKKNIMKLNINEFDETVFFNYIDFKLYDLNFCIKEISKSDNKMIKYLKMGNRNGI